MTERHAGINYRQSVSGQQFLRNDNWNGALALPRPFLQSRYMMKHTYHIDDHVYRRIDGPQGRDLVEHSNLYTILALLPVEADGRLRYRIKSKEENFERIATEESLS